MAIVILVTKVWIFKIQYIANIYYYSDLFKTKITNVCACWTCSVIPATAHTVSCHDYSDKKKKWQLTKTGLDRLTFWELEGLRAAESVSLYRLTLNPRYNVHKLELASL